MNRFTQVFQKNVVGGLVSILVIFGVAFPATASSPNQSNLIGNDWRVFNVMPASSSYWDINQAMSDGSGGIEFPFQPFQSTTTGSFAVYLQTNYNNNLTGKTITAAVNWTIPPSCTFYLTRGGNTCTTSTKDSAYVRLEFQDVSSGKYNMNDYWWYHGSLDLNQSSSGTLSASLEDTSNWINLCGKPATDTNVYSGIDCVGGSSSLSPADGFVAAMKNVKSISLAFGRGGHYASGVAFDATQQSSAMFDMTSFTVN